MRLLISEGFSALIVTESSMRRLVKDTYRFARPRLSKLSSSLVQLSRLHNHRSVDDEEWIVC
jgi:hypothetical protein